MSQYLALALLIYMSIPTSSYCFIERRMLQYRASALLPYISIPTSKLLFKQRHMFKISGFTIITLKFYKCNFAMLKSILNISIIMILK